MRLYVKGFVECFSRLFLFVYIHFLFTISNELAMHVKSKKYIQR